MDGIDDGVEVETTLTDPSNYDTDKDGLGDGEELDIYATDPLLKDTDNDGLRDGTEVVVGSNPHHPDTDGDGIIDGPDGLGDEDSDGIINVLDPTDDRNGVVTDPAPDKPLDQIQLTGGAPWATNCGASLSGAQPRLAPHLLCCILLGALITRRRERSHNRRVRSGRRR
jgi:hypothetical protein